METQLKKSDKGFLAKTKKVGNKFLNGTAKFAGNRYFGSIMEGFMVCLPVIIASSLFMMIAELAPAFGYKYTETITNDDGSTTTVILNEAYFQFHRWCMWAYNLSYGIMGMLLSITIAVKLMDKLNNDLPPAKRVNSVAIAVTSVMSYLCISVGQVIWGGDTSEGFTGVAMAAIGIKGMLPAILVAFIIPNLYKYCYKFNVTIRLPKEVPAAISQSFLTMFPVLFALLIFGTFGFLFAYLTGESFLNALFKWMEPIFNFGGSWYFGMVWCLFFTFIWFIGIHPSAFGFVTNALSFQGLGQNQDAIRAGQHATSIWADSLWMGITQAGGTGCTIAVPLVIILFAKSKQLKTIGWASLVPVMFQVNEPILFGVPMILNPITMLPFMVTPLITTGLGAIWVNLFGMNGSNVALPWCMPQIAAVPLSVGLDWKAFILEILIFAISFGMYTPFILVQDKMYFKQQENSHLSDNRNTVQKLWDKMFNKAKHAEILATTKQNEKVEKVLEQKTLVKTPIVTDQKQKNILVICIGAGSSAILANSINEGAKEAGQEKIFSATATSVSDYGDLLKGMDLVVLTPQARIKEADVRKACDSMGVKVYQVKAGEFVDLNKSHTKAFNLVLTKLGDKNE